MPPKLAALVLALLLAPALTHAAPLLGVTFSLDDPPSVLYDIDASTGAASDPRSLSDNGGGFVGLEVARDGTVYSLKSYRSGADSNSLVTIDPQTGTTTPVGPTGLSTIAEGDIAFHPTSGVLYGLTNFDSVDSPNQLFTIDITTGAANVIGDITGRIDSSTTTPNLSALTFDLLGDLYVIDQRFDRLLQVDPSDASILASTELSLPLLGVAAGMDLDPVTGEIFVVDGDSQSEQDPAFELYTLEPASAVLTPVGSLELARGLSGLAIVLPEPSTAALLATGLLGLAALGRRQPGSRRSVGRTPWGPGRQGRGSPPTSRTTFSSRGPQGSSL